MVERTCRNGEKRQWHEKMQLEHVCFMTGCILLNSCDSEIHFLMLEQQDDRESPRPHCQTHIKLVSQGRLQENLKEPCKLHMYSSRGWHFCPQ